MLVSAGSPIFFLREHRFAVRSHVVTSRQLIWTLFMVLFMLSTCLLHIFLYIYFINIGCATLYYISMMYVAVNNMSFNINCRILAAELNYRFTAFVNWVFTLKSRLENTPLLLSHVLALEFRSPLMRRDSKAVVRRNNMHTSYFSHLCAGIACAH